MSGWNLEPRASWAGRAVMALTVLALVLVAVVPLALLAGVIMIALGQVTGGFALFGGSVLAAVVAVALAGLTGVRHLRTVISRGIRIGPLDGRPDSGLTPSAGDGHPHVVQLDHSQYTEIR